LHRIIVVTGTPGVGKTVLARLVAKQTGSQYLNLGDLVKTEKLYRRFDHSAQSYIIDEKPLRKSLLKFFLAHRRGGVVVETHWLGRFMPKRRGMIAIVVRLDPLILAKRLKRREWPRRKTWENVEAEFIDLSLHESLRFLGPRRVYEIDATRKRPGQLLHEAMRLLSARKGWNGVKANWLQRYDPIELSRKIL
jgi:adenylate kinase